MKRDGGGAEFGRCAIHSGPITFHRTPWSTSPIIRSTSSQAAIFVIAGPLRSSFAARHAAGRLRQAQCVIQAIGPTPAGEDERSRTDAEDARPGVRGQVRHVDEQAGPDEAGPPGEGVAIGRCLLHLDPARRTAGTDHRATALAVP
ncbi:hypothetical protein [Nocardia aurantiaca]|uniref:hypothetical protein n=1 Tax=Nocardia aurantiaca TaxID=2675850 RepID=UPI0018AC748B|nr:hypothetical protein [Nocardia aurantiaca]